jgi:hypothetical protein
MSVSSRAARAGLYALAGTFSLLVYRRIRRHHAQVRKDRENPPKPDPRPTLMFSGAASLFSYYGGVQYYLYHHFDLSKCRCTGISMGCTVAQAITLNMTPQQMFEITLEWAAMIWNRPLKCFLMTWKDWANVGLECCAKFGITDEKVLSYLNTGTAYVGVTDISVFPPQQIALTDAQSLEESLYWTTLSMRIFPFYRYPGWYKGMLIVDGFFSAIWCTPPNADESKLIRVCPFTIPGTDICPTLAESFSAYDVMYSRTKEQMWWQMEVGYRACERAHKGLVAKGLVELEQEDKEEKDEHGVPGTLEHMMAEREAEIKRFKRADPRDTKWRVQSWHNLKDMKDGS